MGIIDVFQMDEIECEDQERLKMRRRKSMPERGRCISMGLATLSWPVAMEWERLEAVAISSVGEREESKRTSESLQGTWHGRAQRGSLWLCYEESLVEKWKSGISGKQHRPKPIPWEKNSWGD